MNVDKILDPFRDEEAVVMDLIQGYMDLESETVYTGDQTPDDLETKLPFIRVSRVGGAASPDAEHTDRPVVDIEVFAATRAKAKNLAQRIEQLMLSCPHPLDSVNTLIAPMRIEWSEDSPIRRFYASYHLALRR